MEAAKQVTDFLWIVAIPLIILLIIVKISPFIIGSKISKALERYRSENLERFLELENSLKLIIQRLIDALSYEIKEHKKKISREGRQPSSEDKIWLDLKFDLFNVDYRGIKIVKPPGRIRRYYTVVIDA